MLKRFALSLHQSLARAFQPPSRATPATLPPTVQFSIDRFVVFSGMVRVSGWIWDSARELTGLSLRIDGEADLAVSDIGLSSPDVAAAVGNAAHHVRFDGRWLLSAASTILVRARLVARFADASEIIVDQLGARSLGGDPSQQMLPKFFETLARTKPGALLEIGSRARSGVSRRHLTPAGWTYTGIDIMPGENVDLVGDAHRLSKLFPPQTFSAVMSLSVLEHLLMPWKVMVELNRVLRPGGIGLFTTHQCWPMHDQPWDFWRFSSDAWAGLLNRATGFEIIEAKMGEPAFIVANSCHPVTNFDAQPAGFLASTVLFRKIGETNLDWDVEIDDVLTESYPSHTAAIGG